MKTLPASTHAVARIVAKNPDWATKSTLLFIPGKSAAPLAPQNVDRSAHAAVQAAARALRERKETD